MAGLTTGPDSWTGEAAAPQRPVDRLPVGVLTWWLATAAVLVVTPFLRLFTTTYSYQGIDGVDPNTSNTNGWGQIDDVSAMGGHEPRLGVLFVMAAALLVLAGGAMAVARRSRWPGYLALLAGGMVVAGVAFQALTIDLVLASEYSDGDGLAVDVSLGAGVWLTLIAGAMAAVAAVLSWRRVQTLRRMSPPTYAMTGRAAERPPFAVLGLWLTMAVVLTLAPLLTSWTLTSSDDDGSHTMSIDGWGRVGGAAASGHSLRFGVLCVGIAAIMIIAVAATLLRRAAVWPIRLGLLASGMTFATGVLQLLQSDANLSFEDEGIDYSIGVGAWLISAMAGIAAAAIILALARLQRLRA